MTDALFFEADACNFPAVVSSTGPIHSGDNCTAHQHGDTETDYLAGCHCPTAREAHRINRGRRHLRQLRLGPALIDATGTRRRLQALAAIGYSVEDLAAAIGSRPSYLGQLQHRVGRIHRRTAAAVAELYQRHANQAGPSPRAVHYATRNGWLPPLWWDDDTIDDPTHTPPTVHHLRWQQDPLDIDDVAVERRIDGDTTVPLTVAEKTAAIRHLIDAGVPLWQVSHRLGISSFYVRKYATAGVA